MQGTEVGRVKEMGGWEEWEVGKKRSEGERKGYSSRETSAKWK